VEIMALGVEEGRDDLDEQNFHNVDWAGERAF
jgi:hypothetical protein